MRLSDAASVFFISLLPAGLLVAWLTWPDPPPTSEPEACVKAAELQERLLLARSKLAQEQARFQALLVEDELLVGQPVPEPVEPPFGLSQDALREQVTKVLGGVGIEVASWSCPEYPCIVGASWQGEVEKVAPDPLGTLASAGLGEPNGTKTVRVREGRRLAAYAVALLSPEVELTPGEELRVQRRTALALERIEQAIERQGQ